jgi:hypothetical protein
MRNASRRRGGKRLGRRQDNKRMRSSERTALGGGRQREVRWDSWDQRPTQPLVSDEHRPAKRKRRKRKHEPELCPAREGKKKHHFLYEEVEESVTYWWYDDSRRTYTSKRRYKMCGYCGLYKHAPKRGKWRW